MPLFATVSVVLLDPLFSTQAKLLNLCQQAVAVRSANHLSEAFFAWVYRDASLPAWHRLYRW